MHNHPTIILIGMTTRTHRLLAIEAVEEFLQYEDTQAHIDYGVACFSVRLAFPSSITVLLLTEKPRKEGGHS